MAASPVSIRTTNPRSRTVRSPPSIEFPFHGGRAQPAPQHITAFRSVHRSAGAQRVKLRNVFQAGFGAPSLSSRPADEQKLQVLTLPPPGSRKLNQNTF